MSITWGDIGVCFVVLVVGSFVAGAVATWWDDRKWDKNKRG